MATYTATASLFGAFKEGMGDGVFNFGTDTLKVLLTTSSWVPDGTTEVYVDDNAGTNDIADHEVSGNGYARQTVTGTWARTGSACKLTLTDPTFTASGGSITARYW